MNSRLCLRLLLAGVMTLLLACSDANKEQNLVDLFATASQDVIAINFPTSTQTTVSISSQTDFTLQGVRSNGVDLVTITDGVIWSLSPGAISTIDQNGRFTAGDSAEMVTLTARLGILSESITISVSSAKFDRVVQLNEIAIDIDMCRSRTFKPVGRYVDENGNEEIRVVDSTIINTIEWIIRNQEDATLSSRAFVETQDNQARLHALAAGDIIIQARALSVLTGNQVTSIDFNQRVSNGLNSIKLCQSRDTDLNNCSMTSSSVEKDSVLSLIAVGNYQAADGSSFNENISRRSKWGISNPINASLAFSPDFQQMDITGEIEGSTASLSVACGNIEQSLAGIDITQGVRLNTALSCGSNSDCLVAEASITIDQLSVVSLEVRANGVDLIDDTSLNLDTRPAEISLAVSANFSNNTNADITDDSGLLYTIIAIDGQADVIEPKSGSPGVFTVLAPGTAKIQLNFRNETFIALLQVP